MKILITGAAGFIGMHLARALSARGAVVIGVDDAKNRTLSPLQNARLALLEKERNVSLVTADVTDRPAMDAVMARHPDIGVIVHLAAQVGVRHSLQAPEDYVRVNIQGYVTLLEASRALKRLTHVLYASSSAVYGRETALPFSEEGRVDTPCSVYAVTKRANELTADSYAHLYGIPQTGLRFFTVYGPLGRPDMAYYLFAKAIWTGQAVTLWRGENLARDFTYIDDIVDAIMALMERPPLNGGARLLNLGRGRSEPVLRLVRLLERELGRRALIEHHARPPADIERTWASLDRIRQLCGWNPAIDLEGGVRRFCLWFRDAAQRL